MRYHGLKAHSLRLCRKKRTFGEKPCTLHVTALNEQKKLQPQIKIQLAIVAIVISRIETLPLLRMIRVYKFFNWLFVKFLGNPRQKVTGHRIQNTPSER